MLPRSLPRLAFASLLLLLLLTPPSTDSNAPTLSLTTFAAAESAVEIDEAAGEGKCAAGKNCAGAKGADKGVEDAVVTDDDIKVDDDSDQDEDESDSDDESEKDADKPAMIDPEGSEGDASYEVPSSAGAKFFDSFQAKTLDQWVYTSASGYDGQFAIGQGKEPTIKGDRALIIPQKARKYGISAKVDGLADLSKDALVLQYEVKVEDGHTCGGAYVKLPLPGYDADKFDGDTPYSVMFGPDKCGSTNKVHFIFQSEHPKTGKKTEHHLKEAPSVPLDSADVTTRLYTLIVYPSNEFEVRVDNEVKANGTLADAFEPPVQMPKMIADPDDKKPKDWVDQKKIADPEATKPDDWDEDAPKKIVDDDATKPDGWLDDEPEKVSDPDAKKPEEWDDEEDGEWEAPLVANPKCAEVGCGEWKKPMKDNPDYKGKWKAPMIDNPKYVGQWSPREIENPDYYEVKAISLLPVGGVAFELWTMDQGMLFDNVWLGSDVDKLETFTKETYVKKREVEKAKADQEREELEKQTKEMQEEEGDEEEDESKDEESDVEKDDEVEGDEDFDVGDEDEEGEKLEAGYESQDEL